MAIGPKLATVRRMIHITRKESSLGNDNERMSIANLWSYWAHLWIYRFAVPFRSGGRVLDADGGIDYKRMLMQSVWNI
jgi:hypothetical protein